MSYGWQIFDGNENLQYDHTVVMSRRLGVYYIPFITEPEWNITLSGIPFNGGTPFAHLSVRRGINTPQGFVWAAIAPDVVVGKDNIKISYPTRLFSYPDDLGLRLALGNFYLHYGVYNA